MNTLTADDKYSYRNSKNFPQPIQMQLSKNLKTFSQHSATLLKSTSNVKHFLKKRLPS